jgi:hypothetical protein
MCKSFFFILFLLAYISSVRVFHCSNCIVAHSILWTTCLPPSPLFQTDFIGCIYIYIIYIFIYKYIFIYIFRRLYIYNIYICIYIIYTKVTHFSLHPRYLLPSLPAPGDRPWKPPSYSRHIFNIYQFISYK